MVTCPRAIDCSYSSVILRSGLQQLHVFVHNALPITSMARNCIQLVACLAMLQGHLVV